MLSFDSDADPHADFPLHCALVYGANVHCVKTTKRILEGVADGRSSTVHEDNVVNQHIAAIVETFLQMSVSVSPK
jgi:hypothetical protein